LKEKENKSIVVSSSKVDDWNSTLLEQAQEKPQWGGYGRGVKGIAFTKAAPLGMGGGESLGFSVGGAKDFYNFKKNIEEGYLPLPESIRAEGVFYLHRFKIGGKRCSNLFCPVVSRVVRKDPLTGKVGYFLVVGLDSNLSVAKFRHPPLDLVVVLDVSGSMDAPLNRYYYGSRGNSPIPSEKTKIELAKQALIGIINRLKPTDRLGIVLFDHRAYPVKPLRLVGETDLKRLKKHIEDEVFAMGGTNWEAGYRAALRYFKTLPPTPGRERRIIFITDAMPNVGAVSENSLLGLIKKGAKEGIWTTFVGVGVDFNPKLVDFLTRRVKGANYLFINNSTQFKKRLVEQFDYLVTPLVFDLNLSLHSPDFEVVKSYGTASEGRGKNLIYISILFPSPTDANGTRGGIVVVQLKPINGGKGGGELVVTYRNRRGQTSRVVAPFQFEGREAMADSKDGEKGVLLVDFVNLMHNWLITANSYYTLRDRFKEVERCWEQFSPLLPIKAVRCLPYPEWRRSKWEREGEKLIVPPPFDKAIPQFTSYFLKKSREIGDPSLLKEEYPVLKQLSEYAQKGNGK
jgi:Ca-activated chloride channel family protein